MTNKRILLAVAATLFVACANDDSPPDNNGENNPTDLGWDSPSDFSTDTENGSGWETASDTFGYSTESNIATPDTSPSSDVNEPETDTEHAQPDTESSDTASAHSSPTDTDTQPADTDTQETYDTGTGWQEPLCPHDSLDQAKAIYNGSNFKETSIAIAKARYPIAIDFFEGETDQSLRAWYKDWEGQDDGKITFSEVLERFNTAAHESGHGYDFRVGYKLNDAITIPALSGWGDTWFPNSEIAKYHQHIDEDGYFDVYLTGDIGNQNLSTLLSEYNQYTHSLAIGYCMYDDAVEYSGRDGALTFLYYIALYVKTARNDHPDTYTAITENREDALRMIVYNWDRAWFWLDLSADNPDLGIDDNKIEQWVRDPDVRGEIDRLRPYLP